MKLMNKIHFNYDDVDGMMEYLSGLVRELKPDLIVGITRGGLLPGVYLSHALNVPMMTLQWQTREDSATEENFIIKDLIAEGKVVVFVDDINDRGETFHGLSYMYDEDCLNENVHYASLIRKTTSTFTYALSALTLNDDRWIVFPWEKT